MMDWLLIISVTEIININSSIHVFIYYNQLQIVNQLLSLFEDGAILMTSSSVKLRSSLSLSPRPLRFLVWLPTHQSRRKALTELVPRTPSSWKLLTLKLSCFHALRYCTHHHLYTCPVFSLYTERVAFASCEWQRGRLEKAALTDINYNQHGSVREEVILLRTHTASD